MNQLQLTDRDFIPVEDSTPSIIDQAKAAGFEAQYYHFGKAEGNYEYFNPSIVQRPDGLWLLVRRAEPHPMGFHFGQNDIWAFLLDDTGTIPRMGKRLRWLNHEASQQFEDPRGFYHPRINQTLVGACTFIWYPNEPWTGAHQCFGAFTCSPESQDDWTCARMNYPRIGGNPGEMKRIEKHENYEKNWLWWLHDDRLHLLYKAKPWLVFQFGETWSDTTEWKLEDGASWSFGDIRGGTTPVRVGDYYFTFHHSSLPWKGRYRRYYAGCLAFDAQPPFTPRLITKEPILVGSQNDFWTQSKPLVVFPCGALHKDGQWTVSLGVNDLKAAWLKLSHESLLSRMTSLDDSQPIFMQSGLSPKELRLQKLRENLAKARAARKSKREMNLGGSMNNDENRRTRGSVDSLKETDAIKQTAPFRRRENQRNTPPLADGLPLPPKKSIRRRRRKRKKVLV